MSEEVITYIAPRLRAMSIAFLIVSFGGVVFLYLSGCAEQVFFGTPIGFLECLAVSLFFGIILVFIELERRQYREEKRLKEFCGLGEEIQSLTEVFNLGFLEEFGEFVEDVDTFEFSEQQRQLIEFREKLKYSKILCPHILVELDKSSEKKWVKCKKEWASFLDDLYLCLLAKDLDRARLLCKRPVSIIPTSS